MATHSITLAWKIPWMEEPGGLQFMLPQSQTGLSNFTFTFSSNLNEDDHSHLSSILISILFSLFTLLLRKSHEVNSITIHIVKDEASGALREQDLVQGLTLLAVTPQDPMCLCSKNKKQERELSQNKQKHYKDKKKTQEGIYVISKEEMFSSTRERN